MKKYGVILILEVILLIALTQMIFPNEEEQQEEQVVYEVSDSEAEWIVYVNDVPYRLSKGVSDLVVESEDNILTFVLPCGENPSNRWVLQETPIIEVGGFEIFRNQNEEEVFMERLELWTRTGSGREFFTLTLAGDAGDTTIRVICK